MAGRSGSGRAGRDGPRTSSLARPDSRCRLGAFQLNRADEAQALARDCADQLLLLAAIAHRPARRADAGGQGRIGYDAPTPYGGDQIALAHHPVAVFHEMDEKIEHLRFDSNRPGATP